MVRTEHHFFVCNSFRLNGEAKGVCHKKNAVDLLRYLESEVADRGILPEGADLVDDGNAQAAPDAQRRDDVEHRRVRVQQLRPEGLRQCQQALFEQGHQPPFAQQGRAVDRALAALGALAD